MTTTFNPIFDTLFKEVFNAPIQDVVNGKVKHTQPLANIKTYQDRFEINLAVPGLVKSDVQISIVENQLIVKADKKEEEAEAKPYKRREFNYDSFKRKFNLPNTADKGNITAGLENGILSVTIFKKKEELAKTIKIS